MATTSVFLVLVISAGEPKCTAIINGVGEISPCDSCCINSFDRKACILGKLEYDSVYVGDFTKRDAALVTRLKDKPESLQAA